MTFKAKSIAGSSSAETQRPRLLQQLGSLVGILAVVWAIPLFVLALPLALAWRAILAATTWRST